MTDRPIASADVVSRRDFAKMSTALALSASGWPLHAPASRAPAAWWPGYDNAVVIDALGGPGGPANDGETVDANGFSPRMVREVSASGLTAIHLTVSAVGNVPNAFEETVAGIGYGERLVDTYPDVFARVRTVADLREAKRAKRVGLIYGFQDGTPIGTNLDHLTTFQSLGVRIIQLTYNKRNLLGDGCLEEANAGLSVLGRSVVEQMNALGLLVDLSHCGQRTTADGIAASRQPVAITHSGCTALADRPRNKRDVELRALAQKGGVVGIYLMPFLRMSGQPQAEDVVRHIEHAVNVCGEDHVGIGTDGGVSPIAVTPAYIKSHEEFVARRRRDGIAAPGEDEKVFNFVPDLNTPRRFDTIADRLAARGHSSSRIEKILGGNFARLFGEVWGKPAK